MKRLLLVMLLCAVALAPADAIPQKRRAEPRKPCDDAQTQMEMNGCADREFKAADAVLNRTYNQLAAKLEETGRVKLKTAEVAWLKYRDSNCDYEAALYEGGSMAPMVYSFCLARMTRARTAELRDQLKEVAQ